MGGMGGMGGGGKGSVPGQLPTGPSPGALATRAGGVSPEQAALAQYDFGQGEMFNNQQFAGTPLSTMKTQADAGTFANQAFQLARMSDADAMAVANEINSRADRNTANRNTAASNFNQQVNSLTGGLGNLAEQAGQQAGSSSVGG